MPLLQPGNIVKTYYQQAVQGDILKFMQESNDSHTGGGARDLRISPVKDFWVSLESFFSVRVNDRERRGDIISETNIGQKSALVTLMGPTTSRPNECRICRISEIDGWAIEEVEFEAKSNAGFLWFYLLVLDDKNQVWASKFCTDVLEHMHEKIAVPIRQMLAMGKSDTIRGVVNFK
jgi:hypothetical protein